MFLFLESRRQRARWIEAEAESLIQNLGPGAFGAARRMEREANDFPSVRIGDPSGKRSRGRRGSNLSAWLQAPNEGALSPTTCS